MGKRDEPHPPITVDLGPTADRTHLDAARADEQPVDTLTGLEQPGEPASAGGVAGQRYERTSEKLGEGGMGVVWSVQDRLIGRRVALKSMRADGPSAPALRAMFMREARVQGQLEHPAIVPVYDVGLDAEGAAYFTMKRVRGTTLSRVISEVRRGAVPHAPRRLLTAFASVCLAVDFAHRHGVVHRDLKPSNLMLGDFGEVHVLDWGVARVLRDESAPGQPLRLPQQPLPTAATEGELHTRAVGTPGYMPPEQALGVAVGPTADVYSLGAILYEMLTLRPLFSVSRDGEQATLEPNGALGPELLAICVRATAPDAADRYPSARALHDEVERYLDGERTVELRRRTAASHLHRARQLLAASPPTAAARKDALRTIGRALALEPDDPDALRALYELFAELPAEAPAEVAAELAEQRAQKQRITARTSAIGYASIVLFVPVLWWIGVRDWTALGAFVGCSLAAAAISWWSASRPTTRGMLVVLLSSTIAFALASTMYGPLVLVPTMIATNTMALALHLDARARLWAIVIAALGILAPVGLAALRVIAQPYAFDGETMVIRPLMIELPALPTLGFLAMSAVIAIARGARSAGEVRDALTAAEERLLLQRWQLRQLLPENSPPPR